MKRLTHLLIILVTLFFLLLLFSSCDKDLGKQPCNCGTINLSAFLDIYGRRGLVMQNWYPGDAVFFILILLCLRFIFLRTRINSDRPAGRQNQPQWWFKIVFYYLVLLLIIGLTSIFCL